MSTEPEVIVTIAFDDTDRRFLSSVLALLSQRSAEVEVQAAFGHLSLKVKNGGSLFTKDESDLMHQVITATLRAGENVRARTGDEVALVKAAAVEAAYNAIKGKIENGK